jgi:hypothetical protein
MSTLEELQQQLPLLIDKLVEKDIMTDDEGRVLLDTIMDANLPLGEMNKLFIDLSNEAGLSVVTDTKEKVAAWRKIIISLMLAGILGVGLERGIPGMYYTLYEKIYITITSLLEAGYKNQQIREFISNPPSISIPDSNIPGILSTLKDGFMSSFVVAASIAIACVNVACSTAQNITEQISMDNIKFTADLATHIVAPLSVAYTIQILNGSYDAEIARFIDNGYIQRALSGTHDTVIDVKRSIAETIAESAIDVNDMKLDIKWTENVVPDRRMEPSTDSSINNEIEGAIDDIFSVEENSEKFSKVKMLEDILEVLRAEDKARAIQIFTAKYRETGSSRIPILLTLLTAPSVKKSKYATMSQPDPILDAMPGAYQNFIRQSSLSSKYKYPVKSDDPNAVKNEQVAFPLERLDVDMLPSGKKEAKITWNKDSDRLLYEFINVWLNEKYPDFVQKLNMLSPEDHNAIIRRIREMASNGGYNLLSSLDDPNLDRSKEELYTLFKEIYRTIKIQMDTYTTVKEDLSGGRRRKKSRRYKKRRATQRKRRVKGRRTRKGKKRRSTKRRR